MNGKAASGYRGSSPLPRPCPLLLALSPPVTIVMGALGTSGGRQEVGRAASSAATRYTPAAVAPCQAITGGRQGSAGDASNTNTTPQSSSLKVIKDISPCLTPC